MSLPMYPNCHEGTSDNINQANVLSKPPGLPAAPASFKLLPYNVRFPPYLCLQTYLCLRTSPCFWCCVCELCFVCGHFFSLIGLEAVAEKDVPDHVNESTNERERKGGATARTVENGNTETGAENVNVTMNQSVIVNVTGTGNVNGRGSIAAVGATKSVRYCQLLELGHLGGGGGLGTTMGWHQSGGKGGVF